MITISVCMIIKNEELVLDRCLKCVSKIADELVIIDTGSSDSSKDIANKYTNKVYDFKWINDFSKARNFAFSKATMEYQMWIDADDIIDDSEMEKINILKKELSRDIDIVTMKYATAFDNYGNAIFTSTRGRLFKKNKNYKWEDPIHEFIQLKGIIQYSNIVISHKKDVIQDSMRNIKIYETLEKNNHKFTPRQLYYFARELKDHKQYKKAIKYFNYFINSNDGWVEDNINACLELSRCYSAINETSKSLNSLLKSFYYSAPRSEICVELGYYYKKRNDFINAKNWFSIAYNLEKPDTIGFIANDYYDYIPAIELCFCYYKLGNLKKAKLFNLEAMKYKPQSSAVMHNLNFFSNI